VHDVVARATEDHVIAAAPPDPIAAALAHDDVVALGPDELLGAVRADDRAGRRLVARAGVVLAGRREGDVPVGALRERNRVGPRAGRRIGGEARGQRDRESQAAALRAIDGVAGVVADGRVVGGALVMQRVAGVERADAGRVLPGAEARGSAAGHARGAELVG